MNQTAHLTDEQFARYRDRTMAPADLLELDSHVEVCATCRDRLYKQEHATSQIRALRAEVSGHLDYAALAACSEGLATPEQREHLNDCSMCQGEVIDLSRFRTELHDRRRASVVLPLWQRLSLPLGIAAAVLVLAGSAMVLRRNKPAVRTAAVEKSVEAPLPAADRQALDLAIATQKLERAPVLDHLVTKRGALLGPASPVHFDLISPVGTAVLDDRPVFRWQPLHGATSYVVSVFDEHFEKVAESPVLTGTDWRPAKPLPRGGMLNWQVAAKIAGVNVHSPAPPAGEARFEVASREVADHIEEMRRTHPGNPLLMAVLFARAGDLDDAQEALRAMDSDSAQHFKESLQKMRGQ